MPALWSTSWDINKLQSLPPCRDALDYHVQRANYVAALWKRADVGVIKEPFQHQMADLYRWPVDNQVAQWNRCTSIYVMKTVFCACKKPKCKDGRCACGSAKLPCTELCQCVECENTSECAELLQDSDSESEADEL